MARPSVRRQGILVATLTLPAFVIATQLYAGYRARGVPVSFAGLLTLQLCHWELWAVAGPFAWSLSRRWPPGASIVRHVVAAPLLSLAILAAYLGSYHALIRLSPTAQWFAGFDRSVSATAVFFFVTNFHVELLVYIGIVAAAHASRTAELLRAREHEAVRLQAELARAKLTALRLQLQPHFLYNALHTIGSMIMQREHDRAVHLLAELGELLRGALAHRDTEMAPLSDELEYLRRYLSIEEERFGDRLTIEWAIDAAANDVLIPFFILQPIVENAFRHGISRVTEPAVIRIDASVRAEWLCVSVYNDGPPFEGVTSPSGAGYGLANVAERLRARIPPGDIQFENEAAGVRVTLRLPVLRAENTGGTV